jgi:hypothetical protein
MPTLIDAGKTPQTGRATAARLWRAQCGHHSRPATLAGTSKSE